jgi:signal peptidase II
MIILDQVTKFLVATKIPLYYSIEVIHGLLNITHVRNPGVAFGLFANHELEYKALIFVMVSAVAAVAILVIFYQSPEAKIMANTGLILIFSGAVGNMIDRVVHKEVIDFVDIYFRNFHWPAFNVADSCITIGVTLMIIDLFKHHPGGETPPDSPAKQTHL